ncbi:MAG TPA: hypothetical protein VNG90_02495, partial [Candidatus Acidoferrum sp.]|nr:hypothetical protein [Candidatus Acidoferrum sp.]
MTNTFLHPHSELHYDAYKSGDVKEALEQTEKRFWQNIDTMLAVPDSERTFENTVLAYARASDDFDAVVLIADHLGSVLSGEWQ